ncbi:hypothetical protein L2E82_36146 [Cichorium intybus]|uniref:Uncharacterized protein n=1 Tax=Cichorium intybus TaxID=13427 RepID=A0ACB9BR35_CICIN|nr:hypothetical protein L2E82_36146 [Cichorium intybus]
MLPARETKEASEERIESLGLEERGYAGKDDMSGESEDQLWQVKEEQARHWKSISDLEAIVNKRYVMESDGSFAKERVAPTLKEKLGKCGVRKGFNHDSSCS